MFYILHLVSAALPGRDVQPGRARKENPSLLLADTEKSGANNPYSAGGRHGVERHIATGLEWKKKEWKEARSIKTYIATDGTGFDGAPEDRASAANDGVIMSSAFSYFRYLSLAALGVQVAWWDGWIYLVSR